MTEIHGQKDYSYRWIILTIIFFTQLILNFDMFQLGGLADRIIPAMHLDPGQFAILLSIPLLVNAIIGIFTGAMADRFGVKTVIGTGMIFSIIACFLRIGSDSFWILLILMLMLGVGMAALNANAAKILGAWFSVGQMEMAMGVYIGAANLGIGIALAISPLFSTIRAAFTVSAIASFCILVIWFIFIKSKPAAAPGHERQPIISYLAVAAKSRNVWAGALAMFFFMGTYITHSGFLANAMTQARGINPVTAGVAASTLSLAFVAGTFIIPVLTARIRHIKSFLTPVAFIMGIAAYVSWIIPFSFLTIILLLVNGFILGAIVPVIMALPVSLPEVGPVYAGSAGGIISTMQMAGAFLIPSYMIIPLAGSNADHVFLYVGIGYILFAAVTLMLPGMGINAVASKHKQS